MFDKLALSRTTKRFYYICLFLAIIQFIAGTALKLKEIMVIQPQNPNLERYGIIITLICIPLALKIHNDNLKKYKILSADRDINKMYKKSYFIKIFILQSVMIFNSLCLYFSGSKSFFFLAFITLVSFFLSSPNKNEIDSL